MIATWLARVKDIGSKMTLIGEMIGIRIPTAINSAAVSYTHLDVYKRQLIGLEILATINTPKIISGIVAAIIPLNGNDALAVMIKLIINITGVISAVRNNTLTNI